jgi:hypothetical protein
MATMRKPDAAAKAKKKSDAAEVARRVGEVLRIRLDGAQLHDTVHYASENGWNVSDRQVATYIRRADELLVERQDKSRKRVIARRLSQREALFARALNAADYRTALAVLADLDKLQGHYPEKDVKELVKLATTQGLRIAELEKRLALATGEGPPVTPPTVPPARPAGAGDPPGRPARPLPGGPGPADG